MKRKSRKPRDLRFDYGDYVYLYEDSVWITSQSDECCHELVLKLNLKDIQRLSEYLPKAKAYLEGRKR